ncbi:MAG TPA: roadblock/LC7 domain-containing protein [Thermoplasmata archaeon]|nr:roadblock/LC7 domain-containing protein [Thermoplasmata archaeon]
MPVAVEALRKMLQDFNGRAGARVSAIVSRSGVPVAWSMPEDVQVDNFATMAATLLGALEVIYSTMKSDAPNNVTVESEGGVLTVREVTGKMFLVALAEKRTAAHAKAIDEAVAKARGFLGEA